MSRQMKPEDYTNPDYFYKDENGGIKTIKIGPRKFEQSGQLEAALRDGVSTTIWLDYEDTKRRIAEAVEGQRNK